MQYNERQIVGRILAKYRKQAKLTQKQVVAEIDHAQSWLTDIERGKNNILLSDLFILSNLYNVPASAVVADIQKEIIKQTTQEIINNHD